MYVVWYWVGVDCGWVMVACVVGMFIVRYMKRNTVRVRGDAVVRSKGWVVSSCVELCII